MKHFVPKELFYVRFIKCTVYKYLIKEMLHARILEQRGS